MYLNTPFLEPFTILTSRTVWEPAMDQGLMRHVVGVWLVAREQIEWFGVLRYPWVRSVRASQMLAHSRNRVDLRDIYTVSSCILKLWTLF
jgi:hypothetical protein